MRLSSQHPFSQNTLHRHVHSKFTAQRIFSYLSGPVSLPRRLALRCYRNASFRHWWKPGLHEAKLDFHDWEPLPGHLLWMAGLQSVQLNRLKSDELHSSLCFASDPRSNSDMRHSPSHQTQPPLLPTIVWAECRLVPPWRGFRGFSRSPGQPSQPS